MCNNVLLNLVQIWSVINIQISWVLILWSEWAQFRGEKSTQLIVFKMKTQQIDRKHFFKILYYNIVYML